MHEALDIAVIHMVIKGCIHLHRHIADEHKAACDLLSRLFYYVRSIRVSIYQSGSDETSDTWYLLLPFPALQVGLTLLVLLKILQMVFDREDMRQHTLVVVL
jgi:hypothetical protein